MFMPRPLVFVLLFVYCSEQLHDDKHHYSDRLKVSKEAETKAVVRATNAEVSITCM